MPELPLYRRGFPYCISPQKDYHFIPVIVDLSGQCYHFPPLVDLTSTSDETSHNEDAFGEREE
uniref:Uncharacterized protein n=1 Tax=Arundo donax TaxID=35708 RepID=A0A0A9B2M4_ARUDO